MVMSEGFIIIYIIVAVNFMMGKMKDFSCNVQRLVNDNLYAKHVFNMVAVFFVIVIFTRNAPQHPAFIVAMTIAMYLYFILLTRCDVVFLMGFIMCMCIIFYIEADKQYKLTQVKEEAEKGAIKSGSEEKQMIVNIVAMILVVIGVVVYMGQHSFEYKKNWDWLKFFLGVAKCQGNGSVSHGFWKDVGEGCARLFGFR